MKKFLMMSFLINLSTQAMHVGGGGNMLHISVALNDVSSVRVLLEDVSLDLLNAQTQSGSTALHIAVGPISGPISKEKLDHKKEIIKALLDKGIDANIKDKMGMTARDKLCNSYFIGKSDLLALFDQKN